ncbi:MAG: hypothetical protein ACM3SX_21520 [Deltaproteobacteria bacterium]
MSAETRFGCGYAAIRLLADIGLHAHGYRTMTRKPGHHQTAVQTLSLTLGVNAEVIVRLDALRKLRNLTEYTGDSVPAATLAECLSLAEAL